MVLLKCLLCFQLNVLMLLAKRVNFCASMRATQLWFPVEIILADLPVSSRCYANSAYHRSEVGKRVTDNTGANSGTTGGMTDRLVSTILIWQVAPTSTELIEPWFRCTLLEKIVTPKIGHVVT